MQDIEKIKEYADKWAYDMELNGVKGDGLVNVDVINQSIEMILATPITSRLFNLSFGSNFSLRIFDNADVGALSRILKDTLNAIRLWEDRIYIIDDDVKLDMNTSNHTITLKIPYSIKERNILGTFSKVIRQ